MTTRLGFDPLDLREDGLGRLAQLDLGGLEHGVLVVRLQLLLRGDQLQDGDAVERPAVRPRHGGELGLGLREGDVEARLAEPHAFEEVLEGEGRLPRAGVALDEVDPVGGEAAAQDVVQSRDPRGDQAAPISPLRCSWSPSTFAR